MQKVELKVEKMNSKFIYNNVIHADLMYFVKIKHFQKFIRTINKFWQHEW